MNLYILRHAIAAERGTKHYPNDDRPLTKEGIERMTNEAICFPWLIGNIDCIYSSPLSRAIETARIAAKSLKSESKIQIINELLPEKSEQDLFDKINEGKKNNDVMIVGHEPHLTSIASLLIGSNDYLLKLKKGALCLIQLQGILKNGAGTLHWLLQPKHLRALSNNNNLLTAQH